MFPIAPFLVSCFVFVLLCIITFVSLFISSIVFFQSLCVCPGSWAWVCHGSQQAGAQIGLLQENSVSIFVAAGQARPPPTFRTHSRQHVGCDSSAGAVLHYGLTHANNGNPSPQINFGLLIEAREGRKGVRIQRAAWALQQSLNSPDGPCF